MHPHKLIVVLSLLLWNSFLVCYALPDLIRIGGLFDSEDEEPELAFRIAVDWINSDKSFLADSRLIAQVERLEPDDSFRATRKLCDLLQTGIAAVFGPSSDLTSMHVQSVCDALEVPHVASRWEYKLQRDDISVNLYPHPSTLSRAFVQLVEVWKWEEFYIVYEENEGIIRLQDFLKESDTHNWDVKLYQFPNSSSYRDVFWDIKRAVERRISNSMSKKKSETGSSYAIDYDCRILLDVPREHLYNALKSAQQVGMVTERQRYIITSLDMHTIDLEDFQYGKTNITGLRLIQEENPEFQTLLEEVNVRVARKRNQPPLKTLRTESALMYETVKLFALALEEMEAGKNVAAFPPISCNHMNKGTDGTSLINYMKSAKMSGVTGQVKFDAEGFRSTLSLDILYLTNDGLQKIGTMIPGESINITRALHTNTEYADLENKLYRVSTYLNKPYAMLKESPKELTGNERFEGFGIDLIEHLSTNLNFKYVIHVVADGKYGAEISKGVWNGMIGEVITGDADMAIADLSITSNRESAVDFTMPFMNTGISILFKKPTTKVKSLFSFLSPFSGEVWLFVMVAYSAVSVVLFIVGRFSPYEWANPHPCRQNNRVEENTFSLLNSMWFTIGSLMQQGSDVAPCTSSTRTIASIWYFFNLIMISSYTANLAAFLTVEKIVYPIENADDLSRQVKIKYGCMLNGATKAFFEKTTIDTYRRMWLFMKENEKDVMMNNTDEAIERVIKGDYAYLTEVTSIQYSVERICNLTQIGGLLDNKGYGIAIKKGNPKLVAWLSGGILKLQEQGHLHTYKERWWSQKRGGGKCLESSKSSSSVTELGLNNVGGVFVVMLLGLSLASMVAVLEFFWYSRKVDKPKKEPLFKMLVKEVKFAMSCGSSVKPAPKLIDQRKGKSTSPVVSTYNTYN